MNNDDDRSVFLNFLAGLGLGALLGAAAALMLAPKSGDQTREDLASITDEVKQKAGRVVNDLTQSGEDLVKKSKELIETTREKVQGVVDTGKDTATEKIDEVKDKINQETKA